MTDIQRTNYDAALAVAIKDAERDVIVNADAFVGLYEKLPLHEDALLSQTFAFFVHAVRELRRVRDGGHA